MVSASLVLALWTFLPQDRAPASPTDNFLTAKKLYASGAYEDALTKLTNAASPNGASEVNQYRALCLLALGRSTEAERALEEIVTQQPLFKMSESDVSPRVVSMFHAVRRKLLPAAARDLYARARASFDQKQFTRASQQFKDLLQVLDDEDLGAEAVAFADLKIVAEGFVKYADLEIATAAKAAALEAERLKAEAAAVAAKAKEETKTPAYYTDADKDVTPSVAINQSVPDWRPPSEAAALIGYRGVLRLLIDEQGRVVEATLVQPVVDSYNNILLSAARKWTFRPARRNSIAVKYEKLIGITLLPKR